MHITSDGTYAVLVLFLLTVRSIVLKIAASRDFLGGLVAFVFNFSRNFHGRRPAKSAADGSKICATVRSVEQ